MQILLVVIMAVVYGLSGILKSVKSKKFEGKKDQKQQGEPFDHTPRFAPNDGASDFAYATPDKSQGKQDRQARPAGTAETISNGVKPQLAMPTTRLEAKESELKPEIEELPEFVSPSRLGLPATARSAPTSKRPRPAVPMEVDEVAYLGEPLLDVSDPEAMRRAILHYEIFGKPLSLRDEV